jgi:glycosyltransferase involved in cell wall biosynthesis
MATKTAIIASRAASIPEVAGESAALYFDPKSPAELVTHMRALLQHNDLRNKLIEEGSKRATLFNWENAAQKTNKIYESVIGTN